MPLDVLFTATPHGLLSLKVPDNYMGVVELFLAPKTERGLARWQMSKSLARSKSRSHAEDRPQAQPTSPRWPDACPCLLPRDVSVEERLGPLRLGALSPKGGLTPESRGHNGTHRVRADSATSSPCGRPAHGFR